MAQTSKYFSVYAEVIANYVAPAQTSQYYSAYGEAVAGYNATASANQLMATFLEVISPTAVLAGSYPQICCP